MTFLLLIAAAHAHPMGSDLVGHRLMVWLDADQVRLDYELELPTAMVLRELRVLAAARGPLDAGAQQLWLTQRHDDIVDSLLLRVDGQPASWSRLETAAPSGVGDERFVAFRLALAAPLPAEARTANLIDLNEPDRPGLVMMDLRVADALRLDATSLVELPAGRRPLDHSGQWRADEAARELRLAFTRRPAALATAHGLLRGLSRPPMPDGLPAGVAVGELDAEALLRDEVLAPWGVAAGLGAALCAGVTAALAGPATQGRALWVTAIAALLCLFGGPAAVEPAWPPPAAWLTITGVLAAFSIGRALLRHRRARATRTQGTGPRLSTDVEGSWDGPGAALGRWIDAPGLALIAVAVLVGGPRFGGVAGLLHLLPSMLVKRATRGRSRGAGAAAGLVEPALVGLLFALGLRVALAG